MKKTKLKELTEYLGLVADEETAARVARELDDPASPLGKRAAERGGVHATWWRRPRASGGGSRRAGASAEVEAPVFETLACSRLGGGRYLYWGFHLPHI